MVKLACRALLLSGALLFTGVVNAAFVVVLSDESTDSTPADVLDATVVFDVIGGNTLELSVTNDTTAPDDFNINEVFWNASSSVSSLTLTSATHSSAGDVFSAWTPVETPSVPTGGFGVFDFALTGNVGETDPSLIQPGEDVVFLMTITGSCAATLSCTSSDFFAGSSEGYLVAAKFVNGPRDDSAFGATLVPVPPAAWLFASALGLLGWMRRRVA